jgi:hypothetical protein
MLITKKFEPWLIAKDPEPEAVAPVLMFFFQ